MDLPAVDLPEPLSPTSPRVSPARISNEIPSTANTDPTRRRSSPPCTGKCFLRSRTSSTVRASSAGPPCAEAGNAPGGHAADTGDPFAARERAHDCPLATTASHSQQAASRPGRFSSSGGASRPHRSVANGQRGAKAHPAISSRSDGTTPGISFSRVPAPSIVESFGIEPMRPRV